VKNYNWWRETLLHLRRDSALTNTLSACAWLQPRTLDKLQIAAVIEVSLSLYFGGYL
jgi:hypothetical protein